MINPNSQPHPVILVARELMMWDENKTAHFLVNTEAREIWIHRPHAADRVDADRVHISLVRVDEHGAAIHDTPNFTLPREEGREFWNSHAQSGAFHLRRTKSMMIENKYDAITDAWAKGKYEKSYEDMAREDANYALEA